MKTSKWKTAIFVADVLILGAAIFVHVCTACMNLKHPYADALLRADFYFCCAGIAWAVFGFSKAFIMREKVWGDRLLKASFIGVVLPALCWVLDCVLICIHIEMAPADLFWGICSTAKKVLRHIWIFFIIYLLRLEMVHFIKTVKSFGLINTIFGEED